MAPPYPTIANGLQFLNSYPRSKTSWKFGSTMIMSMTGILSRFFLYGFHKVETSGLKEFENMLDEARRRNRGVLTVSNHVSVVDDPVLWGLLPIRKMFNPRNLRWSLGAANICFTTSVTSKFFSMGQVLATYRFGTGPYQGSIDAAISLLSPNMTTAQLKSESFAFPEKQLSPQWIHIFPESLYFHWGVSRIILESEELPEIVPIFHCGLQNIFSEDREVMKYIPRSVIFPKFGASRQKLRFNFGQKLDPAMFASEREQWKKIPETEYDGEEARKLRSLVAAKLRESVVKVRDGLGLPKEDERLKDPEFWSGLDEKSGVKVAGKYGNTSVKVIEKEG
ncbi:hypothetical protein BZA70DRAFT_283838 [Myxozyma melibiosi]|uniref:Tafazzin family protein n=1 Tax=Myxozyma melibiosi TaxID=54550 RepID=A0ABR1EZW3_9ASCO